ncbi:MAG: hypothetical protein BWK79_12325 [Beggiatoa sp. IS2]|nr:MAG: hypothetical protein BWK79_12325 [Beggiatoa sp. IS2]
MKILRNILFINVILLILFTPVSGAGESVTTPSQQLAVPQERVILTIKGKIARSNGENGVARFDRAMLEKLPQKAIKTTTRWTEGLQEFEGVLVTELLKYVGATGTTIESVALDDYVSPKTPIDDFEKYSVILAIKKNGEYIRIRDKGPIWMIYPMDDYPELRKDLLTQYKLIWHVRTIIVE